MEETHVGCGLWAGSDNLSSVCGCREHCQGCWRPRAAGATDAGGGNEQTDDDVVQDGVDYYTENV